jgi:hypothetical protein
MVCPSFKPATSASGRGQFNHLRPFKPRFLSDPATKAPILPNSPSFHVTKCPGERIFRSMIESSFSTLSMRNLFSPPSQHHRRPRDRHTAHSSHPFFPSPLPHPVPSSNPPASNLPPPKSNKTNNFSPLNIARSAFSDESPEPILTTVAQTLSPRVILVTKVSPPSFRSQKDIPVTRHSACAHNLHNLQNSLPHRHLHLRKICAPRGSIGFI